MATRLRAQLVLHGGVIIFLGLLSGSLAAAAGAQPTADDFRGEAVNAVLRFRADLSGDSTRIARCRLPLIGDSLQTGATLDERFRGLLTMPPDERASGPLACSVFQFARSPRRTLWLQQVIEIRRDGGVGQPYPDRRQYEITFQLLVNAGYREYHRYVVAPTSGMPEGGRVRFNDWRVIEYKLQGWDFHWGDNAGHGSSARPPESLQLTTLSPVREIQ